MDDHDVDLRVTCGTCRYADGERCTAHPRSGLKAGVIGGITEILQHCPAWRAGPADCEQLEHAHPEPTDPRELLRRTADAMRLRRLRQ